MSGTIHGTTTHQVPTMALHHIHGTAAHQVQATAIGLQFTKYRLYRYIIYMELQLKYHLYYYIIYMGLQLKYRLYHYIIHMGLQLTKYRL